MGGWRIALGLVLAIGCGQRSRTPAAPDEASPDATAHSKQVDEARKWLADVGLEISGGAASGGDDLRSERDRGDRSSRCHAVAR